MRYLIATYPGKSTVIDLVAKWVTSILQKSGDSPDQPYVLKTALPAQQQATLEEER